ncbi:MAG: cytochrome c oxidase subunit II [Gemmataceae bacterium]|nr:cytochrome c oxidase subunit II [Gemmataceae bacterium]
MEADFELFPAQASTIAPLVDGVFWELTAVTAFFTVLIAVMIMVFAIKYRRRSQELPRRIEGSLRLELFWTIVPLVIVMYLFYHSTSVYFTMITPPADAMDVYVVGRQWMWAMQHTGGQREINTLHVPVGRPVKLTMTSQDVIHSFFVPAFRIKQDVLPGRYTTLWFQATRTGKFHLFCTEYCGTNHSTMRGTVHVMEPRDFELWQESQADGSLAAEGRKLFLKLQCVVCHSADARARGPVLEELYRKDVPLEAGLRATADDNYLRESILNPRAKIVAGYQPIMPPYEGEVTEEQVIQLVAYLKTLGRGQTPLRVEATQPPAAYRAPEPPK